MYKHLQKSIIWFDFRRLYQNSTFDFADFLHRFFSSRNLSALVDFNVAVASSSKVCTFTFVGLITL